MSYTIIRTKSHSEWLSKRHGIGSSAISMIIGVNPFHTAYEFWASYHGHVAPEAPTRAMRFGCYMEEAVARAFECEVGYQVLPTSHNEFIVYDSARPYLTVSPDRLFWLDPNGARRGKGAHHNQGILECKTTQCPVDHNNIPPYWYCQLQYQMGVCEMERGALAWISRGRDLGYQLYDFDADYYAMLVERATDFYERYLVGDDEPPLTSPCDVVLKHPRPIDSMAEANQEAMDHYLALSDVKAQIMALTTDKRHHEERLKMMCGEHQGLKYNDQVMCTWRAPKPRLRFDEQRFRADHTDLYNQYLNEVQGTRRFLLK